MENLRLVVTNSDNRGYFHRRKSDGVEVFQIKNQRWACYWREQAYPVMLVIRTSDGEIPWMNVTQYLGDNSKGGKALPKQIEFGGEPFTALSLHRTRNRLIPLVAGT